MIRVGIIGASGFTGAELLRLCAGHPELDVVRATGDTPGRHAGRRAVPEPGRRSTATGASRPTTPGALDGLDLVFLGLPHGASQALVPELRGHVTLGRRPGRRLPAGRRRALPDVVRRGPRRSPSCSASSSTACPSCSASTLEGATAVAVPGCYPTAVDPRPRPAGARPGSSSRPASSSTPPRACPAPVGRPKPNTTFCAVDEDFTAYGLLTHRHTPEMEQSRRPRSAACRGRRSRCCSPRTWRP